MISDPYIRNCKIVRVIDGDTVELDVDLGYFISTRQHFRLAGINAPEIATPEGKLAKAYLEGLLAEAHAWSVLSSKLDKYGRRLGEISCDAFNVSDAMVAAGHAVPFMVSRA